MSVKRFNHRLKSLYKMAENPPENKLGFTLRPPVEYAELFTTREEIRTCRDRNVCLLEMVLTRRPFLYTKRNWNIDAKDCCEKIYDYFHADIPEIMWQVSRIFAMEHLPDKSVRDFYQFWTEEKIGEISSITHLQVVKAIRKMRDWNHE